MVLVVVTVVAMLMSVCGVHDVNGVSDDDSDCVTVSGGDGDDSISGDSEVNGVGDGGSGSCVGVGDRDGDDNIGCDIDKKGVGGGDWDSG